MIDLARSLESAEQNAESYLNNSPKEITAAAAAAAVNHSYKREKGCWNCGNRKHPKSSCPAKDQTCHKCNKVGHYAKLCKSRGNVSAAALEEENPDKTAASALFTPFLL